MFQHELQGILCHVFYIGFPAGDKKDYGAFVQNAEIVLAVHIVVHVVGNLHKLSYLLNVLRKIEHVSRVGWVFSQLSL